MSSPPEPRPTGDASFLASPKGADRLAFPLDVGSLAEARLWIARMRGAVTLYKVGLELFVAEGPAVIDAVHESGAACFLDLKLHDIPATVAGAVRSAVRKRVRYLTIHAGGGEAMMRAAQEAAQGSNTTLLAVTVLTSMDAAELMAVGDARDPAELVVRRAVLAQRSGVGGLVCSPAEVAAVRAAVGPSTTLVIPGIRPEGSELGDQRRVGTPESALADGANVLVVGRPIRNAPDPIAAARAIIAAITTHEQEYG